MTMAWLVTTLPVLAGPVDPPADEDPLPIDNWVLFLGAAAIIIGAYFIIRNNRKALASS